MQALGVGIWAQGDPADRARSFAQEHGLTFPVLVDAGGAAAKAYRVRGVPTNVVVGKDGTIRYLRGGYDEAGVRQAVEAALGD